MRTPRVVVLCKLVEINQVLFWFVFLGLCILWLVVVRYKSASTIAYVAWKWLNFVPSLSDSSHIISMQMLILPPNQKGRETHEEIGKRVLSIRKRFSKREMRLKVKFESLLHKTNPSVLFFREPQDKPFFFWFCFELYGSCYVVAAFLKDVFKSFFMSGSNKKKRWASIPMWVL